MSVAKLISKSGKSMSEDDINTVLSAFATLLDQDCLPSLDFTRITSVTKRFGLIDQHKFDSMLLKYATFKGPYNEKVFLFVNEILHLMSFTDFALVLSDSGYTSLCDSLLVMRNSIVQVVQNRHLPHADKVHEFYINLKRCADDNAFQLGPKLHFEKMISEMSGKLLSCSNPVTKQLVSDKLVALFFLLAKQYSDTKERANTYKRLRQIMPRDVDRTTFDAVFHSHMALNWAIQGDEIAAEKHERLARLACENCSPCLATAAMRLNTQCKNNRLFYENHNPDFLNRAYFDFEMGMHCSVDFDEEEKRIWNTISSIEMCHSLLGINLYLEVCDIDNIDPVNIERARVILDRLEEPLEARRKMFYKLAKGRMHEKRDIKVAQAYVQEACVLTSEGCYKEVEKVNMQNYLNLLIRKQLPSPSL